MALSPDYSIRRALDFAGIKKRLVFEVANELPNVAEVEPCSQDWWRHQQEELKSSLVCRQCELVKGFGVTVGGVPCLEVATRVFSLISHL